jgi:hypothetical protein
MCSFDTCCMTPAAWLLPHSATQACINAVSCSLQQLEGVAPGSCSRLLCEAMLQLSINEQQGLHQLKAAAGSMFASRGGGELAGATQSANRRPGSSAAAAASQPHQQQQLPWQQHQQQHRQLSPVGRYGGGSSKLGLSPASALPGVGQLGPLGSYLLNRWREDAARAAAAAAAQSQL